MKYIEQELNHLKEKVLDMFDLNLMQLERTRSMLEQFDHTLAKEVIHRERNVNATDLMIDSECENIIALYAPVAIDLRFVIAMMRLTNELERIGDFCEGIAEYVLKQEPGKPPVVLFQKIHLHDMVLAVTKMLQTARKALEEESSYEAIRIIDMDSVVDQYKFESIQVIADHIQQDPSSAYNMLLLYGTIRRLERLGDHCTNIAEELIFYLDAKVLRHQDKL